VSESLAGLWGFALTPFRDGSVDPGPFATGVRRLADGGVDVIIAAGTLGQGDRMTATERVQCVSLAVAVADGRVPVLATLRADDDPAAAAQALAAGAAGALLLPVSSDPAAARAALRAIDRATDGQLAVVLYQRAPLTLEPADLADLARERVLVGLKDAFGDMRRFRRLRESLGRRLTWVGASEDLVLAFWAHGADAVSPASLAYAPAYGRRMWDALGRGDRAEAARLLRLFAWPVTDLRLSRPHIDITVVREFAAEFGLPVGDLRPPAEPLTDDERGEVRRLAAVLRTELESAEPGLFSPAVARS
jgi:5-dehydro-4-deoxyglucarate dehydratase